MSPAMKEYRVNDDGRVVSIWDDSVGVGFEFRRGDGENEVRWRFRTSKEAIFKDGEVIRQTFDRIVGFARERFPQDVGSITL